MCILFLKTFKASLYSSEKHFIFNNVLLMNRWLTLRVFIKDKETSGLVIIKNKSLVPWRALSFIFNNHQAIGLYLLHNIPFASLTAFVWRKDICEDFSYIHQAINE